MTSDEKECYNQLLAIFLDYPEENREDFISLLNHYESNFSVIYTENRLAVLHDKLNFSNEVRIAALKQLIKIFDIKRKSDSFISGFGRIWNTNGKVP